MDKETYQEETTYEWVKSKNRTAVEMPAYDKLSDLLGAEWYGKDTLVYIISEKQIYRAKHTKRLKYIGRT